ncbi:MAG TPA: hypothetical protein VJR89_35810 [Polyangiales bacterium]|nr:hypothetical protein [Polyangiales bacterium]
MTSRWLGVAALLVFALPNVALACPMCFTGNNSNQSAFLWGSLFLMFVPTATLGALAYWAYRRMRAQEAPPPPPVPAPDAEAPVLRVVRDR